MLLMMIWLTSGMGAFLVFVDNKTDLGVMTFVLLAVFSTILFVRERQKNNTQEIATATDATKSNNTETDAPGDETSSVRYRDIAGLF